ncbi:glycosyltransferase [Vibrio sp.]|uniref:glycosyltransferase n=1 Tax=Vibrio sp. TaxID=678 RepID=UPI00311F565D
MSRKVLFVLPTDTLAGSELNLYRMAKELSERGLHVIVIFMCGGNNNTWSDVNAEKIYLAANKERLGVILLFFEFYKFFLRKEKFDYSFSSHVHCNAFISLARAIRILIVNKQILRESTNIFSWFSGVRLLAFKMFYRMYSKDSLLICQTQSMYNELIQHVPCLEQNRSLVLGNPIDYKNVEMRSLVPVNEDLEQSIVFVGRLVGEKGVDILIEAFKLLGLDLKLVILGDGPLLNDLKSMSRSLGLSNRIRFIGHCNNPLPYMKRAKLTVTSSIHEGFPNVLLEQMAVSSKVVCTECAEGISNLPGITVCRPNSATSLMLAMQKALGESQENQAENISLMREHVKQRSVKNYVNKIIEALS